MNSPHKQIAILFTSILLAASFLFAFGINGTVLYAILVAGILFFDLAATFLVLKRKSLISFSLSLLPVIMMWTYLLSRHLVFLVVSLLLSLALYIVYSGRLPETRKTTDGWIGMLIITCISTLAPFIVIAAAR